jgi:hypothetical protein
VDVSDRPMVSMLNVLGLCRTPKRIDRNVQYLELSSEFEVQSQHNPNKKILISYDISNRKKHSNDYMQRKDTQNVQHNNK